MHLNRADAVKELLGIPYGVTQFVLLPVAHTIGTEFRPTPRVPARTITYVDRWGDTRAGNADGPLTHDSGAGVAVETEIDAAADATWNEPNRLFAWAVRDPDAPRTQWRFELIPLAGATRLRFAMTFGPGPSGLTRCRHQGAGRTRRMILRPR